MCSSTLLVKTMDTISSHSKRTSSPKVFLASSAVSSSRAEEAAIAPAIATANAHTLANRLYTTFLTSSPEEGDFRLLIRLGGVKEKDAAITLLDRFPTLANADFVTRPFPDLALYALEHIEHSGYEVMAAIRCDEDFC